MLIWSGSLAAATTDTTTHTNMSYFCHNLENTCTVHVHVIHPVYTVIFYIHVYTLHTHNKDNSLGDLRERECVREKERVCCGDLFSSFSSSSSS